MSVANEQRLLNDVKAVRAEAELRPGTSDATDAPEEPGVTDEQLLVVMQERTPELAKALRLLGLRYGDARRQARRAVKWYCLNAGMSGEFDDWDEFKEHVLDKWRDDPAYARLELDVLLGDEHRCRWLRDGRTGTAPHGLPQRPRERRARAARSGGRRSGSRGDPPDDDPPQAADSVARPARRGRGWSSFPSSGAKDVSA
jgi:hypothetical protein